MNWQRQQCLGDFLLQFAKRRILLISDNRINLMFETTANKDKEVKSNFANQTMPSNSILPWLHRLYHQQLLYVQFPAASVFAHTAQEPEKQL